MTYQPGVVVSFDRWQEIGSALVAEAVAIRRQTAEAILEASVGNAAEASGALKAGHYLVDPDANTYAAAVAAARAKNPNVEILPMVAAEKETTIVAVAVSYGDSAEFYTGEKNPDAHPFLGPAAEAQRPTFDAAVAGLDGRIS